MRTDELRNDLRDLALAMEPFDGDPKRVRGRVQRRRLAIAGGALVLAAVLAVPAVVFATRDAENQQVTLNAAKSVALDDLAERDALVTVPLGGDARSVQAALESSMDVRAYLVLRPGAATMLTRKGAPDSLSCQDQGSFLVDLEHGEADLDTLSRQLAPRTAVLDWRQLIANEGSPALFENELLSASSAAAETTVFMSIDATATQIEAVRSRLTADPDITSVRYLDHAAAYEEFKRIFRGETALIESTTADALPTSFRLVVRKGVDPETVAARLGGSAGVDEVLPPQPSICN